MSTRIKSGARQDFWRFHVQEFIKSELSQREYCRRKNISYWSFNSWKRRIDKESETAGLIEIPACAVEGLPKDSGSFEIRISDSVRISIPDDFNPEDLKRILRTLGAVL